MMKAKERKEARSLRRQGFSVREIASRIKCAKSSVSKWVHDIPLTQTQIERLKSNQDKGRARAAQHPNSPKQKWARIRNKIIEQSSKEIPAHFSGMSIKILGTALYWAEGYTASKNAIIFANTDPRMVQIMMMFFREICKVPEAKFRGKISIHPHLNVKNAERYWSRISKIPIKQFNKPLLAVSRASQGKRDTLPMGTFSILIGDVYTCSKIKGWIKGLASCIQPGG